MPSFKQEDLSIWLILLLPAAFYLWLVNLYSVNVPYWDDYRVILLPMNQIAENAGDIKITSTNLLLPNSGHIPLITRCFAWLQIQLTGHIDFRWGTIVGNLGLVISAYLLMFYLNKRQHYPLSALIPLPYLLFSISHWGSMHFMVPAWQFYWGSTLLPLLALIAVTEECLVLSLLAFAGAIYISSSSLVLYPLILLFLLIRQRWKSVFIFALFGGLLLMPFFLLHTISSHDTPSLDIGQTLRYISGFMGSFIPNSDWNSEFSQLEDCSAGTLILAVGIYSLIRIKGGELMKLIFAYAALLSVAALLTRSSTSPYIPSRYSLFSLMAISSLALLLTGQAIAKGNRHQDILTKSVAVIAMLVWVFSLNQGKAQLIRIKDDKMRAVQMYAQRHTPESLHEVAPNVRYSEQLLSKAMSLGIVQLE